MYLPFIFSFFFSEIADRAKKMNVIATGLFVGALSFVLLSFVVHQLWVVILASLISLSVAIIRPAYNGIITQLTPRKMLGEISGINNLFVRLGHIVGPILSGVIADLYGIQIAFFLIAIIALGLGITTLLLHGYEYFPTQTKDDKLKLT
jgi:MFS family permease